ncbi:MAG: Phosphoribosylaminoimidazole carboxylase [uncultured bacterium]|uniref:N5-carboxyaminoimidazole ribonucleotide mutase n=3 Tax=Candidatus Daviesiibacteriota TaxID=1752718 RepID=A0A0G0I2W6_9BACT|nr:MAG: Phosphoribosylaminoimidazole carboxylase [uncultured bacterium]KKQ10456.1 MAG: N5-carboxyaminoimidazole ribonucleotide mutase [Candidatus Daviesbacteria bacterium GW2011_GWB1_36_5]KKQ16188.1 MAG: N5-carboxyaminoimidazole ribonucleotide mutase [Candidatus Daviesbacteria bacterium GW2011_GWA1_36_8]OGE33262.1 MAG: 5-(carboxyamino)imidazole ribonucleotide mutase [Candidatus Daviesbacteria bacterium RIFCSPHIGHO2_02_FULL_37_9]OGE36164.1 MAG: 5-(carboxyamino)imidazole ribonucleotide mutase [Ca
MSKSLVGIIMGSDSDLPVMADACKVLEEFNIPFEIKVLSAHRAPDLVTEYAKGANLKGLKVIIAAAGGAAHLAGVAAAHCPLPVIGVPIKGKTLDGLDSLLSIVQMPPGIPVATVSIDGARNAGILAIEILAVSDKSLIKKLLEFKKNLKEQIILKNDKLKKIGYKKFLEEKEKANG